MKEFKYKTVFSSIIKPIISKDKNLQLAKASLDQLRQFIPNVDVEANYDLLPVAFPLFNVNYFNKNDDGVDTEFALRVYKTFANKFIDLNHKRDKLIGVILSAHITEFGTDKPLTEEDVKNTKDVFNITVGGVLWRAVNEGLTDLIEESNNILDENFDKIKASFEVGFTDLKLVKCPANSRSLAEGTIIDDPKEISNLSAKLKAFGGTGQLEDGSRIYRLLAGEGIGLGAGITESPAGFLNAIAVPENTSEATFIINTDGDVGNSTTSLNSTLINSDDESKRIIDCLVAIDNRGTLTAKDLADALNRVGLTAKDAAIKIGDVIKEKVRETLLKEAKQEKEDNQGLIGVIAQNKNKFTICQEKAVTETEWKDKLSETLNRLKESSMDTGLSVEKLLLAVSKAKPGEGINVTKIVDKHGHAVAQQVVDLLANKNKIDIAPLSEINKLFPATKNKISQSENQTVIQDKNLKSRKNMKFTKIQDITDETLKEATASSVAEFVETELKVASEKYAKEKLEKESAASELQKKHDELVKNQEQLVKDLEVLKANLQKLEQEKLARETQATFNTRMASFEDKYTLTEDELAVVGSQIKDLNDEQYKKTEASLSILLKGKSKSVARQEAVASENTKTETQVIDKALDGAQKTSKEVAATSSVQTPTLKERYAKAFSKDQFVISK